MPVKFFYDNLISFIIGNIIGIVKLIRGGEEPIWVSKFRVRYIRTKDLWFIYVWAALAAVMGFIFLEIPLIGAFFFTTGILFLVALTRHFEKLFVFKDRVEVRFFLHTVQRIYFNQVCFILRDKESKSGVHILYTHPVYGVTGMGGDRDHWRIPVNIFKKKLVAIEENKVHPNIFLTYQEIKDELPSTPITMQKIDWNKLGFMDILISFSVLLINPYSIMLLVTIYWGLSVPWLLSFILIDLSIQYTRIVFKSKVARNYKYDWNYINSYLKPSDGNAAV